MLSTLKLLKTQNKKWIWLLSTCGDLDEECDRDGDGEDEHGEHDHLQTLLAVVAATLPEAVHEVAARAASQEHRLN